MSSLIPFYNEMYTRWKRKGLHKITCNELYNQYKPYFNGNRAVFTDCLAYLEQSGKAEITKDDFADVFLAVTLL